MRAVRVFLRGLGATAITACAGGVTAATSVQLRVSSDRAEYSRSAAGDAVARLSLEHGGGRAVALTGCPRPPSFSVEQAKATRWEQVYSSGITCIAILTPSTIAMTSGSSLSFTVTIGQPGRFRVRLLVGPDPATPEFTLVSNEFVVH